MIKADNGKIEIDGSLACLMNESTLIVDTVAEEIKEIPVESLKDNALKVYTDLLIDVIFLGFDAAMDMRDGGIRVKKTSDGW